MSDELAELRAQVAALQQQLSANQDARLNAHLNEQASSARREAGKELTLRADRNANLGGVSETARETARILMEHDPLFYQMAQKAKQNDRPS